VFRRDLLDEAQPQPDPIIPCGEKRLEEARQVFRRDPRPGIAHRQHHLRIRTAIHLAQTHGHLTAGWRSLHRVQQQIDDRLMQPFGIALQRSERGRRFDA
jgi:hypothetical protein